MGNKALGCGIVIGVIFILIVFGSLQNKDNQGTISKIKERPLKELAMESVKIKGLKWYKGGFGTVMIADITIENKSPYDIKDITIFVSIIARAKPS